MRMRKKIVVGVGLVVVALAILGPPCMTLGLRAGEPPLRVGMTSDEAEWAVGCNSVSGGYSCMGDYWNEYTPKPDWLGKQQTITIDFDSEGRLESWTVKSLPRTRPPWLDRAAKVVGW